MPVQTLRKKQVHLKYDWKRIAELALTSRHIDAIEERELYPQKKVLYQFSARGHEVTQSLLGSLLTHPKDGVGAYYRARPLLLSLGLSVEDAFASDMAASGGFSNGRDIGVVCNLPPILGATVLPMGGDVGSQYTSTAGWAQALLYRKNVLKESIYEGAIAVVLGGEGSVATNGFWSALTMATTLRLPMLFVIEDNGYAISVTSDKQTPGANIARNLDSFTNLRILDGNGTEMDAAATLIAEAIAHVRAGEGPALLRLTVPRLSGHSGQDTQAYKPPSLLAEEQANDPLDKLRQYIQPEIMSDEEWTDLEQSVERDVRNALQKAMSRPDSDPTEGRKYIFAEYHDDGSLDVQKVGGLHAEGYRVPTSSDVPQSEPTRINMVTALRRTMEVELQANPKLVIFGEDVGAKGGVHAATMGLQEKFGEGRVFDTSLSEEGIIGRAVGMAVAGLMPVAEIQFRKYADPATEQLNNCGFMRWRTYNRFAAPIVVRMPGGFFKCGDPWHSVSDEVEWIHGYGWQVAMPSNAEDAVGLLRAAMRSPNPTIFFEHRHLLDAVWARRPYPGDEFVLPFGKLKKVREGKALTVVTWGAMVERCELAADESGVHAEILDLRTLMPWDKDGVIASVRRTRRCLVVHEDNITAGFGAEVAAMASKECFFDLDAPVERVATPDVPVPYNVPMMNALIPSIRVIAQTMTELVTL